MSYSIFFRRPPSEFTAFVNIVYECFSPRDEGLELVYTKIRDEHVRCELRDTARRWGALEIKTTIRAGLAGIVIFLEDPPRPKARRPPSENEGHGPDWAVRDRYDSAQSVTNPPQPAEHADDYTQQLTLWFDYRKSRLEVLSEQLLPNTPEDMLIDKDVPTNPPAPIQDTRSYREQVVDLFEATYAQEKAQGAVRNVQEWLDKNDFTISRRTLETWRKQKKRRDAK